MKKLITVILVVSIMAIATSCSSSGEKKTLDAALSAIYTCPNNDIVVAFDITKMPISDDAVQSNTAADEVIATVYGEYFTDQALELLASGGRASKFHLAAADGGYTMSVSKAELSRVTDTKYDFTAEVVGVDITTVAGRVQFKDGKISSLRFTDDIAL